MTSEEDHGGVLLRRADGVATLVLNEPERRNPMSPAIMQGLESACDEIEADDEVRVVVLTGAGSVFCAGGDLRYNDEHFAAPPTEIERFLTGLYRPFLRILDLPMPTVAAVNGPAVGGGFAMILLCDLRVAVDTAVLRPAFASLGFVPGMGFTYSLPAHVGRATAAEILFADRSLHADEALELGLLNRVVSAAEFDHVVAELTGAIEENGGDANRAIKRLLTDDYRDGLRDQLRREIPAQVASAVGDEYRERRARITGRVGRAD